MKTKVVIIGAGPAGIAAAVQLKRQGINPVIIEKNLPGGLILNASKIENYPGFPNGISGIQISKLLKKHLEKWNIEPVKDNVLDVRYITSDEVFNIICENNSYQCEYLILATGTKAKTSDILVPEDCKDKIFYEVYPLLNLKQKVFTIIGGGDAAFDYALNLSRNNQVNIFNRSNKTKALPLLVHRAKENKNISCFTDTKLNQISKSAAQLSLNFSRKNKNLYKLSDFLIFAIGREANLDLLHNTVKKKMNALIKSKKIFLIGDVKNDKYRQLSIAVGDGVRAAMELINY